MIRLGYRKLGADEGCSRRSNRVSYAAIIAFGVSEWLGDIVTPLNDVTVVLGRNSTCIIAIEVLIPQPIR